MTALIAYLCTAFAEAHERAAEEAERGEVAEKVIIVAGFALLAIAVVAAITLLVNGKLAGISL
ncbi:MAG TPA: hypothetical protein VNQ73_02410 [Ilumatobacter sp.]|nr:hypothetical protein [Ilumatobacter sp.]